MRNSRAFTLVEMLAVMSVGSVLLALGISLVHRTMRLDADWRAHADTRRAMSRLAHDLRDDVHRATNAEVGEDGKSLTVELAGAEVTYVDTDHEIVRTHTPATGLPQREFYRKPEQYQIAMETLYSPDRVKLTITRNVDLNGVSPRPVLNVEAEVGRLSRLANPNEVAP